MWINKKEKQIYIFTHSHSRSKIGQWTYLSNSKDGINFSKKEADNSGSAVQDASTLVKQLSQCDRVYAIAFGEGAQHLHLHLIPRFIANPATKAWSVADHYRSIDSDQSRQVPQDHLNDFVIKARRIKGTILRYS